MHRRASALATGLLVGLALLVLPGHAAPVPSQLQQPQPTITLSIPAAHLPLVRDGRPTFTPSNFSPTRTGTRTQTTTITRTPTISPTITLTPSTTKTATASPTVTETPTLTETPTDTQTPTITSTRDPALCAAEYPDVCIPPPPPDLNCGDIISRNFTVLPPDRHGFDTDNDGVGCEQN